MAFIGLLNPYIALLVDEKKEKYIQIVSCAGRL